jgi:zinc transport system permease protein
MSLLSYGFMQNALFVSVFIAILCPCIGIFLVLRGYSMIGDTLAHSSLAGVTIGLLSGQSPVLGAFVFTAISGALIELLRRVFRKKTDLILAIVLALSVGAAITIISSGRLRVNADAILYGSILTVTRLDCLLVLILSVLFVGILLILYNQLLCIAYDEEAAQVAGVRTGPINYLFFVMVAAAIAVSIRIVGVLVLSSMIALPVATALQLRRGFKETLLFSIVFSIIDIMLGLIFSYYLNVAPGGFTALVSVGMLAVVLIVRQVYRGLRATKIEKGVRSNELV